MKASGIRSERETIIRFDDDSDFAEIWTASEVIYRKLRKAGFEIMEDNERSAVFKLLKSQVKFRKARILSESQRLSLQARGRLLGQKQAVA